MNEVDAERLNLFQKLAKIRSIADVVTKDKRGFNYTYADITAILAKITAGMKKYEVSLIPSIVPGTAHVEQNVTRNTKVSKDGKTYENVSTEMLVKAEMVYRWVNDNNPEEFIDVPWFMVGSQSDPSQALGSAMTYTLRQFLTNYFQIAQAENDVDAYRTKQKEAEAAEDRAIVSEIISNFDTMVRNYLAKHEDKEDEVKKFISRYVKNGNYKAIKEPNLAANLVSEFKEKFMKE